MARIGFVSSFPPTRCGLATFADALAHAMLRPGDRGIAIRALDVPEPPTPATPVANLPVVHHHVAGNKTSITRSVSLLNGCDLAVVQHEYGIYGGPDGDEIVTVLDALTVPRIVVTHTVLEKPTLGQRHVMARILERADAIVCMTDVARNHLEHVYDAPAGLVHVIPHGVTEVTPLEPAADADHGTATSSVVGVGGPLVGNDTLNTKEPHPYSEHSPRQADPPIILTWGLIGPGKGIEWGILAMSLLVDMDPMPHYRVLGQTHPKVFAREGDSYRDELRRNAYALGVAPYVHLDARYQSEDMLARNVQAAAVVLLPYDSSAQVTSGVLAEAVAAGKPVVATAFPHAIEVLGDGSGVIVPHADPVAIAHALRDILTDEETAARMSQAAAQASAGTSWRDIGERYRALAAIIKRKVVVV